MTRYYLAAVGFGYLLLAVWCMWQPAKTAASIGFDLRPGSGQSEYFTVYGGLQLALGLVFLLPLVHPEVLTFSLVTCLLVHGCLALARTASLVMYSQISGLTLGFAGLEWVLFLATFGFWLRHR